VNVTVFGATGVVGRALVPLLAEHELTAVSRTARFRALCPVGPQKEHHMHATIRRYEGVDMARTNEVTGKVNETLVPQLRKLPGFAGYYLIEGGNGVLSSLGLFETPEQADESTKVVAKWITDENFNTALPNAPKITSGKVVAQSNGVKAVA